MTDLTEEEAEEMIRELAKSQDSVQAFFRDVIKSKDTTRVGNLNEIELGIPKLPERSVKELELFANDVWGRKDWAEFWRKTGENITATSLSKDGFLLNLAVTKKSHVANMTPQPRKENKGWFRKKNKGGEQ